jgi:Carbohydrate binding domain (family 11).
MKFKILSLILLLSYSIAGVAQADKSYNILDQFIASGYMGDTEKIIVKKNVVDNARPDSACTKITYTPGGKGWGGVYWQYPENNWCIQKGKDFSTANYTKITFYARGEKGGEEVRFKVGQDCGDSFVSDELVEKLPKTWKKFTIDLTGKDLSNITGAFCWIADSKATEGIITFFLDDVHLEK